MKKHNRLNSMLRVDFRRMFTSSMLHILCGAALVMPILILVMTSMVAGTTAADPLTGAVTTVQAFTSAWQIIVSSGGMMAMDMTAMCNINLIFFMAGVYVCLFIAVAVSCFAGSRSWLSIMLFAFAGMLLFMMIPMMTPLDAGVLHVGLCLAGSAMFGFGPGAVSNMLLSRQDLV